MNIQTQGILAVYITMIVFVKDHLQVQHRYGNRAATQCWETQLPMVMTPLIESDKELCLWIQLIEIISFWLCDVVY